MPLISIVIMGLAAVAALILSIRLRMSVFACSHPADLMWACTLCRSATKSRSGVDMLPPPMARRSR